MKTRLSLIVLAPFFVCGCGNSMDVPDPAAVVDEFHAAMTAGDDELILSRLAPHVRIFESGGAELSRTEYKDAHMKPDIEFAKTTKRTILDRYVRQEGDLAWVMTLSEVTGVYNGREIATHGAETIVLELVQGYWQINHIHWSSRPMNKTH